MSLRNSIGNLVSEKVFYRACVILLGGLPIVEIITEIIHYFTFVFPSADDRDLRSVRNTYHDFILAFYGAREKEAQDL